MKNRVFANLSSIGSSSMDVLSPDFLFVLEGVVAEDAFGANVAAPGANIVVFETSGI